MPTFNKQLFVKKNVMPSFSLFAVCLSIFLEIENLQTIFFGMNDSLGNWQR